MAEITTSFGSGGANLAPGGAAGTPTLATALREVADDLAALQPAEVTSDDPEAVEAADPDDIALADAGETYTSAEQGLVNALKAGLNASNALVRELKTKLDAQGELVAELKAELNARHDVALKTTKA